MLPGTSELGLGVGRRGLSRALSPAVWVTGGQVRYAVVASHGVWRSLVACFVRDEEVVGSNPATPTKWFAVLAIPLKTV